jgi:subtilisin family serine protease
MRRPYVLVILAAVVGLALTAGLVRSGQSAAQNDLTGRISSQVQDWTKLAQSRSPEVRYVPGRVLVKFKEYVPAWLAGWQIASYHVQLVARLPQIKAFVVGLAADTTVEEAVAALELNPEVEYAEPDYIASAQLTPNDTFFNYQYALSNTGQEIHVPGSPRGKPSADIKATAAWEETRGDEIVVVAVLDTGVDLQHPDLMNKISSSGRDFVNGDFDASDDHGHGTYIAGIIGADTDNGQGIAGVAWNCLILPVKVLDNQAVGEYSKIAQGIIWAADNGASVINLSLGYTEHSTTLRDAVKYAYDKGVVLVAGTGNTGGPVEYPAAYDAYCLAVAATDYNDARPAWSNFGSEVDVAAPGVSIFSTVPRGYYGPGSVDYGFASGTSASAAHASGLAALIISLKPFLTVNQVMDVIRFSADDVNAETYLGKDEFLGYGRINMEKALVPLLIKKKPGE